ncbi:MAG: PD40 domain-containing protein [Phycisphaerae bacterium]|nr:PD40 domain-containing protein [Phycisphaerae bacterium]
MHRVMLTCLLAFSLAADKLPPAATLPGHTATVTAIAFSPDGKRLASTSDDGTLKIWDIAAKKQIASLDGVANNRNTVHFSPDGKTVITLAAGPRLLVVDAETGKAKQPIEIADLPGGAMWFDQSPDGKSIAVVGRSTLRVYDVGTGKMTSGYEVHSQYAIPGVAFSPDGKSVATVGTDRKALIADIATGKITNTFDLSLKGESVTFSPDGKQLFIYTDDRVITAFDVASGESKKIFDGGVEIFTMSLTPDGKRIIAAGASRDGPGIISIADAKLEDIAFECDDRTKSAAISLDGQWLAAGGNEGSITLWQLPK